MTNNVVYDTERFVAAHKRFLADAKTVTDDDLALFALVNPEFAERARAMRAGFVPAESEETQKVMKLPLRSRVFFDWIKNHLNPTLATFRYKGHQLETRIEGQQKEIESLKARVLELEAREAAHGMAAEHVPADR